MADIQLLDSQGNPLQARPAPAHALTGQTGIPFDAADMTGQHTQGWQPYLHSVDMQNMFRDRIVAREKDLVQNDGWAKGIIQRTLDNSIGAYFRPIAKPDYQALQLTTGNKAFDAVWAEEFAKAAEAYWRIWSDDPGFYCDASRNQTLTQMLYLAFRHYLVDGDSLGMMHWRPERVGDGKARYATCLQIIDPDRLSNPQLRFDTQYQRGGIDIDDDGVAVAYNIRKAHQGDWFMASQSVTWEKIQRETPWGRPIIVHHYDLERANQHRGAGGILNPIVTRMKMLIKHDQVALDAAILNAVFGAYIESPFDSELVASAVGGDDSLNAYQQGRSDFHAQRKIALGETRIPILFPGEKINAVSAERPSENFQAFETYFLRSFASATGLAAPQVSNDWSDVNYSSARGALLEAWKTLHVRTHNFAKRFASQVRQAWLEESFDQDDYPMPRNAPAFYQAEAEYSRCIWLGPPKGVIDVVKEREGSQMAIEMGLSTLERELADQQGTLTVEEVLDQRRKEIEMFNARGIPLPQWAGSKPRYPDDKQP